MHVYEYSVPDKVTDKGVNCWWDRSEQQARDNVLFFPKADTIVLAVWAVNNNGIVELRKADCAGKSSIFAAIRQGSEVEPKI
jgi:hypothetical protein